jgi:hypothetical protein
MAFEGGASISGRISGVEPGFQNGVGLLLGEVDVPEGLSAIALMEYARLIVRNVHLDERGAFEADRLEPGIYTVVAYSAPPDMASPQDLARTRYTARVVTLKPGETVNLDLNLE